MERVAALLLNPIVRHVFHDADDHRPIFRFGRTTAKCKPSTKGRAIREELPREALIHDEQAPAGGQIRFFVEAAFHQLQPQRLGCTLASRSLGTPPAAAHPAAACRSPA